METYHTWARLFELLRYYSWIIDRFHTSTRAYQLQTYERDYPFCWLEQRLDALDFHLVFVTRKPESFAAARERRLKVSGNPSQYDDLQVFVDEQELMRELVDESTLTTIQLDISDNDVDKAVDRIADWMTETGGLWAEES
jgi:thymidylate kinase